MIVVPYHVYDLHNQGSIPLSFLSSKSRFKDEVIFFEDANFNFWMQGSHRMAINLTKCNSFSITFILMYELPNFQTLSSYIRAAYLYTFCVFCTQKWQYKICTPYTGICTHKIRLSCHWNFNSNLKYLNNLVSLMNSWAYTLLCINFWTDFDIV